MSKVVGLGVHEVGGYLLLYTFVLNTSSIGYYYVQNDTLHFGVGAQLPSPRFSASATCIHCA